MPSIQTKLLLGTCTILAWAVTTPVYADITLTNTYPSDVSSINPSTRLLVSGYINPASLTMDGEVLSDVTSLTIGYEQDEFGTVTINIGSETWNIQDVPPYNSPGPGSGYSTPSEIHVGYYGEGHLYINSGTVNDAAALMGYHSGSTGEATVKGSSSHWISPFLFVGYAGDGKLNVKNGGFVETSNTRIGDQSGSTGTATVTGSGSTLRIHQNLSIGSQGDGTLNIENGGQVKITSFSGSSGMRVARKSGGTGTVNLSGGTLDVDSGIAFGQGTANFNLSGGTLKLHGTDITFDNDGTADFNFTGGTLTGVGKFGSDLQQNGGTLQVASSSAVTTIDGDYHLNQGTANLAGGTLDLNGHDIYFGSGASLKFSGGRLAGVNEFHGDLVQQSGTLQIGNSPADMIIDGDYTLADGGTIELEIFSDSVFDTLTVLGTADLAGTINLILMDGYTPNGDDSFDLLNFDDLFDNGYDVNFTGAPLLSGMLWDFDPINGSFNILSGPDNPDTGVSVPAPSSLLLAILGLALVGLVE